MARAVLPTATLPVSPASQWRDLNIPFTFDHFSPSYIALVYCLVSVRYVYVRLTLMHLLVLLGKEFTMHEIITRGRRGATPLILTEYTYS